MSSRPNTTTNRRKSTSTNLSRNHGSFRESATASLQSISTSLKTISQATLDRIMTPATQASLKDQAFTFARTRPLLASFILSQIALSGIPLIVFLLISTSVVVTALLTGIIVGLIGAGMFIFTIVGFALLVLLPTLFVTTFFAVSLWMWAVGAYMVVRMFNERRVPGVHRPLKEGVLAEIGMGGEEQRREGVDEDWVRKLMNGTLRTDDVKVEELEFADADVVVAELRVDGEGDPVLVKVPAEETGSIMASVRDVDSVDNSTNGLETVEVTTVTA